MRPIDGCLTRRGQFCDRLDLQERSMYTKTQKLMLQGGLILLGALLVSSVGGWARRATADDQPTPLTAPAIVGELRSLEQSLEATRGELAVARLQLERANAIIDFSTHYSIAADLAAAIYDVSLAEGVDPALAFRLVRVESGFNPKAKSKVGAIGYTQVLPSTARLYEPPGSAGALRRERRRQAAPGAAGLQPRAGEGAGAARRREGSAKWLCGGPYEGIPAEKLKT